MQGLVATSVAIAILVSCGGTSREQVMRSQREYDLAVGLYGERDTPGAFEHLFEAIELDPENAEAHLLLGNLYMIERQDFRQAEHHLREAIRVNALVEGRAGLPSEARTALGVLFNNQGRFEDGIEELEAASSDLMNRHQELTWANLAWAYLEQDRLDEALQVGRQAIARDPNHCVALYRLAEVHIALEQDREAQERLDHLLSLENPACQSLQAAWRLRGEVRARMGQRSDAISDLERCVELSSENEDGRACQRLLDGQAGSE